MAQHLQLAGKGVNIADLAKSLSQIRPDVFLPEETQKAVFDESVSKDFGIEKA